MSNGGGVDEQRGNGSDAFSSNAQPVDGALRAWAVAHARTVGRTGDPSGAALQPDDALPAGPAGRLVVTARERRTLTGHTREINSAGWATGPDGRLLLASGSFDDTVRIWDPITGATLQTLTGHTGPVVSVAWATSPDGRLLLASGSADATVRVWDPITGHILQTLTGRTGWVVSVGWVTGP
ncbi:WD40 repeat domain-containing protein, partial [Frankia sp. Cr2]|uniref:WD40 repeat domain-containing protein n=1 Tax=Frankia sp. Cr2 TaxID=3073932 RepID=UPI003A0FF647